MMYFSAIIFLIHFFVLQSSAFLSVNCRTPRILRRLSYADDKVDTPYDQQIDLLYDSDCPICQMEVDFLKKRDIHHRIRFTDLSSDNYDPAQHGNVKFESGMRKIQAVLPDKTVVKGVEVFRRTYDSIGLGWVFAVTKVPVIGQIADFVYDVWAENRLRITGRGDLADILKERAMKLRNAAEVDCDDACDLDFDELEDVPNIDEEKPDCCDENDSQHTY